MPIQIPVHKDSGKWYFWEETWAERQGPFDTEKEAIDACNKYCKECLGLSLPDSHVIKEE